MNTGVMLLFQSLRTSEPLTLSFHLTHHEGSKSGFRQRPGFTTFMVCQVEAQVQRGKGSPAPTCNHVRSKVDEFT